MVYYYMVGNIESGFSGPKPEGEIPEPTPEDVDEIIGEAARFSRKKNSSDQMFSEQQEPSERISVDVVDGDVIVSKSGTRRKVTEIVLHPGLDGGGKIVFTIERGDQKKFGSMTFAEYDMAKHRGVIDRIERKNS